MLETEMIGHHFLKKKTLKHYGFTRLSEDGQGGSKMGLFGDQNGIP